MGMRTYAISDYGLYVTTDDVKSYAEKNDYDDFDCLMEIDGFNYFSDAEGECNLIMRDDSFYVDDSFAIASLNRYPSLFEQAYKSKEDALQELKDNYAKYLPDNFDFEGKFVRLTGTTFG